MIRVFDPRQLAHAPLRELHNGGWTAYHESPDRAETILAAIGPAIPARDGGMAPIAAVHDAAYLEFLQVAHRDWVATGREGDAFAYTWPVVRRRDLDLMRIDARLGRYSYDAATPITAHSWTAAYWSAQTALTALDEVVRNPSSAAFALCRPPGHHAGRDYLGGYCFLNNAAIVAAEARRQGLGPVAILDVDYHHGNGTQDIFYEDPDMLFVSIHADPSTDYPFYWGHADERGAGAGLGTTLNLPLPRGTDWAAYAPALDQAFEAIEAHGTRLLVLSFGADTFGGDPISHFALEREDFRRLGQRVASLNVATVTIMEGGYATSELGSNVAMFLTGLGADTAR
ncbi:histone deacetylase family protein [Sphingomonas desiccabilis]|uniref:Histone deacetylase family protein n=1 Tax=Sphingomonas desiccabilis TaxID=429134 RepID=A0A4Q2IPA6_9SPHN|nr:histone deacetylase family protein [Sphingomonas desiccabilis]MBB3912582.1 acetoin utilization deacetylase AcuC-like enzyme [Sphingomonas desiccabilis]RXZ29875.1 histone deacetylase family protein [Sphingomonas desiccabilis]